ncbi:MAG: sensor signal transduction histidine kinase [Jatrophihabitantaceae bacterium]|nr:sensor signal transduction histidine kinase [Jatrophihabitantaceae bacterium]
MVLVVLLTAAAFGVLGLFVGALATRRSQGDARAGARSGDRSFEGSAAAGAADPIDHGALSSLVIDSLDLGVAVIDSDYAVRIANPAIRRFELVVGTWVDPRVVELLSLARRTGVVQRSELDVAPAHRSQDGRAVGISAVPLHDHSVALPAGRTDYDDGSVAVIVVDITDARRLEAVRRDFVANVSHELKTPVGALSLLAETLFTAADDPEAVAHFAAQVQRESTRLGAVVAELIELSRLQGAEPLRAVERVPVRKLIDATLDRARVAADTAGITLVAADPGDAAVTGSERQLVTALGNLIDNAIAYSSEGTRVVLAVRTNPADDHSVGLAGPWVEISVSDQGVGIAEGDLERVFERFYRVDPARSRATGGTGLGLAIVKHIVANHGGTITVWSVEGAGSTFTIRLPRSGAEPPPAPAGSPTSTHLSRSSGAQADRAAADRPATAGAPALHVKGTA